MFRVLRSGHVSCHSQCFVSCFGQHVMPVMVNVLCHDLCVMSVIISVLYRGQCVMLLSVCSIMSR